VPMAADERLSYPEQIMKRGKLRVGYVLERFPFSFKNLDNQLVGFDIEMARILARELNVDLELVKIGNRTSLERASQELADGRYDIVMSAVAITSARAAKVVFTKPYLFLTLAFVVKDSDKNEFINTLKLQDVTDLKVGVFNSPYWINRASVYVPRGTIVPLVSIPAFFKGEHGDLDALFFTAEEGSAWSLLYPSYGVAVPHPGTETVPTGYAVSDENLSFVTYLNSWIDIKEADGTIDRLYDYWILGNTESKPKPRWSVIRDVLHWQKGGR